MRRRLTTWLLPDPPPSRSAGIVVVVLTVGLITAVFYPLRAHAPIVSTGVLYLLAVLLASTGWGLGLGLATGLLCAATFNWFHIPPTGGFTVAESENWVALGVFLLAAVLVSTLADAARARAAEAETRREEADRAIAALEQAAAEREALMSEAVEARALRQSDEIKTAILRAVSHDLRSPLTAILAAGEALASTRLADDDRTALAETVCHETERLARLVDKLLDLSRLEAGSAPPRPDWCALDEVIDAAIHEQPDPSRFTTSVADDLPLLRVDAAQVERAVANLLENAARHSAPHTVQVRARAVGDRVMLRVIDRGPGIPAAERARIFEPFHRGTGTEPSGHAGSGLGLAIVRGFVEANGGTVAIESFPGQGTTFVLEFPAAVVGPAQATAVPG